MLRIDVGTRIGQLDLDLQIEVAPGSCTAVTGRSGAGKTTLLRIVAGLLRPDRGRVSCEGDAWLDKERGIDLDAGRRRCGYVFQDYALFPRMCGWQNVAYGLLGVPRAERREVAMRELDRFGIAHLAEARPQQLSGGERQRLALARALAIRPRALLLDEPLSALDPGTAAEASRELALILRDLEVPTLLVTHDFEDAALLSDRVAVIEDGKVAQLGTAAEIASRPRSRFVADLTGAMLLRGSARPGSGGLTWIDLDGGGTVISAEAGSGEVSVSIHSWEITIEPRDARRPTSAQNRLDVEIVSLTPLGPRVRLGLAAPQPLTAEVTPAAVEQLNLTPGAEVAAVWKASATRIVAAGSGDGSADGAARAGRDL